MRVKQNRIFRIRQEITPEFRPRRQVKSLVVQILKHRDCSFSALVDGNVHSARGVPITRFCNGKLTYDVPDIAFCHPTTFGPGFAFYVRPAAAIPSTVSSPSPSPSPLASRSTSTRPAVTINRRPVRDERLHRPVPLARQSRHPRSAPGRLLRHSPGGRPWPRPAIDTPATRRPWRPPPSLDAQRHRVVGVVHQGASIDDAHDWERRARARSSSPRRARSSSAANARASRRETTFTVHGRSTTTRSRRASVDASASPPPVGLRARARTNERTRDARLSSMGASWWWERRRVHRLQGCERLRELEGDVFHRARRAERDARRRARICRGARARRARSARDASGISTRGVALVRRRATGGGLVAGETSRGEGEGEAPSATTTRKKRRTRRKRRNLGRRRRRRGGRDDRAGETAAPKHERVTGGLGLGLGVGVGAATPTRLGRESAARRRNSALPVTEDGLGDDVIDFRIWIRRRYGTSPGARRHGGGGAGGERRGGGARGGAL